MPFFDSDDENMKGLVISHWVWELAWISIRFVLRTEIV